MIDYQAIFLERLKTFLPRELARVELEALEIMQKLINQHDWDILDEMFIGMLETYDQEESEPGCCQVERFRSDMTIFVPSFQSEIRRSLERAADVAATNESVRSLWYNFEHGGDYGGKSQLVLTNDYSEREDFYAPVSEHWLGSKIKGHPRFRLPKITLDIYSYVNFKCKGAVEMSILMRAHLNSRIAVAVCRTLEEIGGINVPVVISRSTYNPVVYRGG